MNHKWISSLQVNHSIAELGEKAKKTQHVNPNAITNVKQAFQSGYKAAMRGVSLDTCSYRNPLMGAAWERGWLSFQKNKPKSQ
jgi:ribosome modulation factor